MWRCLKPVIGGGDSRAHAIPAVCCNALNSHFVNVGPATARTVPPPCRAVPSLLLRVLTCSFSVSPVSLESLMYTLGSLNASKSCGTDGISVHMFQKCFYGLGHVLHDIVNLCLTTGCVPSAWKHGLVTPLPKSDDLTDVTKFRPITVVPGVSKIVERIVYLQLSEYFDEHRLWSATQHGYRKLHSTEAALPVVRFYSFGYGRF